MSLVLAPIHDLMYQKVLRQDRMSDTLLATAEAGGWDAGLRFQVDREAPAARNRPLETVIDQTNIHGWLNQAVQQSERRFALVVTGLLAQHPEGFDALCAAMTALGKEEPAPSTATAEATYQWLTGALLDGMPCDRTLETETLEGDEAVWRTASCAHTPHWTPHGLSAERYYLLRDAWITGALWESRINYTRKDTHHRLLKEA